jgi:uncharacterized protein YndB with AHSA1/START domain
MIQMTHDLIFDFAPNRAKGILTIRREFAAPRQLVWDCHTQAALLDRWFAPSPLTARTKSMDFRPGGHWHYAMIEPSGKAHWGHATYLEITPLEHYSTRDSFADESGAIASDLPTATWEVSFEARGAHTLVHSFIRYPDPAGLETVLGMGMEAGMVSTLERLDALLPELDAAT